MTEKWIDDPIEVLDNIGEIPFKKGGSPTENIAEVGVVKGKNGEVGLGLIKKIGGRFIAKTGTALRKHLDDLTDIPRGKTYTGKVYRNIPSEFTDPKFIVRNTTSDDINRFRTGLYLSETKAGNIIEVNAYGGTTGRTLYEISDVQLTKRPNRY